MNPDDDPAWASYAETILTVHAEPPLRIDLSQPVTPDQRDAMRRIGLDGPFGLVTPCNPRGRHLARDENAVRLARFLAELTAAGKRYLRVEGASPDGSHVEPGVALAWPQPDLVALARKWSQSAIYWWDGASFWVIGALTASPPWPLGQR